MFVGDQVREASQAEDANGSVAGRADLWDCKKRLALLAETSPRLSPYPTMVLALEIVKRSIVMTIITPSTLTWLEDTRVAPYQKIRAASC